MGQEANIATQIRMIEAVNRGDLDVLYEIFADNVVDHDPAADQGNGPAGYITFFRQFRAAFPDLKVSIEHMIAADECVAIAVRVTGTHLGSHRGVAPTNRKINIRGMQIARFDENARIKERWGSSDELGMLQQIQSSGVTWDSPTAE